MVFFNLFKQSKQRVEIIREDDFRSVIQCFGFQLTIFADQLKKKVCFFKNCKWQVSFLPLFCSSLFVIMSSLQLNRGSLWVF